MISLKNVIYRYEDSMVDALQDLTINFPEGSFTAIMGSNGSGKSTLARCLNGLLLPTSGEVLVDGLSTRDDRAMPEIRKKVGFVFQDPNLQMTSASVERELAFGLQNIETPSSTLHEMVDNELQRLNVTERRTQSPTLLSGGEKVRLVLAAVLLLNPKYIVLDEPSSVLSPSNRKRIIDELLELRRLQGRSIILITQFLSETEKADRLILLNKSRVAFTGTPEEAFRNRSLLTSCGVYVPPNMQIPA